MEHADNFAANNPGVRDMSTEGGRRKTLLVKICNKSLRIGEQAFAGRDVAVETRPRPRPVLQRSEEGGKRR